MNPLILIPIFVITLLNPLFGQLPNLEVEGAYKEHIRLTQTVGHIDITAAKEPLGLFVLDTNNTKLMSLISTDQGDGNTIGRLGLGIAAPQSMLSLRGPDDYLTGPNIMLTGKTSDQVESGRIRFVEGTALNNYRGGYIHYDGSANRFHIGVHSTNGSDLTDEINAISIHRSNGFVGLGTPNPSARLHSFDGTLTTAQRKILGLFESKFNKRPTLFLSKVGTSVGYGIEYDGTIGSNLEKLKIFWKDTEEERNIVTINNGTTAGRVGINTTSPVTDLEVTSPNNPTIRITSASIGSGRPQIQFNDYNTSTDWAISTELAEGGLAFSKGNASGVQQEILRINDVRLLPLANGTIDLGSSTRRFKTIFLTQSPNVSSDKRLKEDIKSIKHGLNSIMQLNPVQYKMKNGVDRITLGLIAQEVEGVIPEAVHSPDNQNDYYALRYAELIPVLVKAIQEQQEQLFQYEKSLEALTAEVEIMKNKRKSGSYSASK